jgi:GGDEF domain-containing protein
MLLYCIYQLSDIFIAIKHFNHSITIENKRLKDLDERFERSVDFATKRRTSHMNEKIDEIKEQAQKDPMTKALNRQGLVVEINRLINDSNSKIFSIALIDLDEFKAINDTKGHIVGDDCLKFLSYTIMVTNRKIDMIGRYGGD